MGAVIELIAAIFIIGTFCDATPKVDVSSVPKFQRECKAETGYDYENSQGGKLSETRPAKCFTKCMSLKAGLINDKGEPQVDKLGQLYDIPGFDVVPVLKKCYDELKDKADICEKVAETETCVALEITKFTNKT